MANSNSTDNKPLAILRKSAGLSRNKAAVMLDVGLTTLARYENGENDVPFGVGENMAVLYNTTFENIRAAIQKTKKLFVPAKLKKFDKKGVSHYDQQ